MKKFIILFFTISIFSNSFCQSVYDDQTTHIFKGNRYLPKIEVIQNKEQIKYTLFDKTNKIVKSENINFVNLPLERYLCFYNSIGFISDINGYYFYDFITNKRLSFNYKDVQYDRYNEGIQLGKFNPILKANNLLVIIDEQLSVYRTIQLRVKPNSKEYWILMNEETDVITGKIRLLKCVKLGRFTSENKYDEYIYDVSFNKLKLKN